MGEDIRTGGAGSHLSAHAGPPDPVDLGLQEMLDAVSGADAATARRRRGTLDRAAREEASLVGVLQHLVDARAEVVVATRDGRSHRGMASAVGADFLAMAADTGLSLLVRRPAITSVRPAPGQAAAVGGAAGLRRDVRFLEVLAGLAPEAPQVSLHIDGDASGITGTLLGAGRDVVTLRVLAGSWTDIHVAEIRIVTALLL